MAGVVRFIVEMTTGEAAELQSSGTITHLASRAVNGSTYGKFAKVTVSELVDGEGSVGKMLNLPGAASQALAGLQVANLVVSVAGFAILAGKLNALDRKVERLLAGLRNIGRDVNWVREVLDADLVARLRAIARQLSLPVLDCSARRQAVLGDLVTIGELFDARRGLLLSRREALADAGLFALYSEYLESCIHLQLATAWQLNSPESALILGRDWTERLKVAADQFAAPVRTGAKNVRDLATYATLDASQHATACEASGRLSQLSKRVANQTKQIGIAVCHNLRVADLATYASAHPGQGLIVIADEQTKSMSGEVEIARA